MNTVPYRNRLAQVYMLIISALGWAAAAYSLFHLPAIGEPVELLLLLAFLFVCEFYPMPFPKGSSSLSFPVVYLTYLIFGLEITVMLHFISVLLAALINRRPARIVFFNPAQFVLSLLVAHFAYSGVAVLDAATLWPVFVSFLIFICTYYTVNNGIVDFVLLIRPEKYPLTVWAAKTRGELFSFTISLIYGFLLHFLGSQARREADIFSYFFFLSPLIFLSILSSVIIRLRADKQRLKALFNFSSELNKAIPVKRWETDIQQLIGQIVSYEECFLFLTDEKDGWRLAFANGSFQLPEDRYKELDALQQLQQTTVFNKPDWMYAPLSQYFEETVQTAVYAPLTLDSESVGCLIMTKTRTKGFSGEDVQSIATIANQLAIFLKTQLLFSEKEQRMLLEERNRIAQDIHDGIAQTLAGAIMKLDTAAKKISSRPADARQLVISSNDVLRDGLKEVRNSIYALRPMPTEELGLHAAIERKIEEFARNGPGGPAISFSVRGAQQQLSLLTEKVIFSVIQESIQNSLKHANATKIDVLLRYQREEIFLKIKDNGIGFSLYEAMTKAMKEPHYGIIQMNESAAKIGAALQISNSGETGTEIIMRIPKMGLEGAEAVD
ncbi:GAF domain-containing sensor histidine kinase [Planococcus lenghuensis]|nr:GAF domain-containing sensor histidine kinase [Planococcus lenghuensis]